MATVARRRGLDAGDIEIWFGDEARIGQKNKITRRWARRGSRPSAPSDQRTVSTYIFGAICPKEGKAVGLILALVQHRDDEPASRGDLRRCGSRATRGAVARPGRLAPSHKLAVPHNITIVPLPPKCPELNPQENVWQFMRDNWLSNRVFDSGNALLDHCCDAWNKLEAQPWTIMSIGMRNWAHRF